MLPILNVGPLALQTPLLILLLGVWFGLSLAEKEAEKFDLSSSDISNLVLVVLGGVLVGGRLMYVLQHLDRYLDAPLGIILPNPNTLALMEGLVLGLVAAVIYGQRRQLPFWGTLDVLIPSISLLMAAAAGMSFASGSAYGLITDVPWAIELRGGFRHPAQAYEAVLYGITLAGLLLWKPIRHPGAIPGVRFLVGAAVLAGARLFVEAFRADALTLVGGWRAAQLAALGVMLAALVFLRRRVVTELQKSV